MASPHLSNIEKLDGRLTKGIIVVPFAKEALVRKQLSIIKLFWIIKPFFWKITYRL